MTIKEITTHKENQIFDCKSIQTSPKILKALNVISSVNAFACRCHSLKVVVTIFE